MTDGSRVGFHGVGMMGGDKLSSRYVMAAEQAYYQRV